MRLANTKDFKMPYIKIGVDYYFSKSALDKCLERVNMIKQLDSSNINSVINNSFIGALFVQEEYQGQGIGKKLIKHCKSLYPSLELCVYTENKDAVNFYLLCDFIIVKEQLNEDSGFMEYVMKWIK